MTNEKDFINNKQTALLKLDKARKEELVDEKILPVIDLINKSENYFTSSSCAGRIVLLELPSIGDKQNAEFLGRWHRDIIASEILSASKKAKKGQLWLLAQSHIIHVVSKTNLDAENILKIGISSGFKNSGIKSMSKKIVVELCSTERLDTPVGKDGNLYCDNSFIQLLVDISNDIIKRSNLKIDRLKKELKKKI